MAKRKTPARNSKGRFVKGSGGGGRKSSGGSVALARRAPSPIVIRETRMVAASGGGKSAKRKGGAVRAGGGDRVGGYTAMMPSLKAKAPLVVASTIYGWATGGAGSAAKVKEMIVKIPTVKSIGAPATHGLILTFVATKTKGNVRKWADRLALAALMRAGHNLGASGFDVAKAAQVSGYGDMSGALGADDVEDMR